MVLLILPLLATKALAFSASANPSNTCSYQQLKSNKQEAPLPIKELLTLVVEDEDELSEFENNSSENALICHTTSFPYSFLYAQQAAINYTKEDSRARYNESLYILLSIFRI